MFVVSVQTHIDPSFMCRLLTSRGRNILCSTVQKFKTCVIYVLLKVSLSFFLFIFT